METRIIEGRFRNRMKSVFWKSVLMLMFAMVLITIFHLLEKEPALTMLGLVALLFAGIAVLGPRKESPPPARRGVVVTFPNGRPAA